MNCGDTGKGASRHNPASRDSAELFMSEMLRGRGYFQHGSTTERHHSLCCRIVLMALCVTCSFAPAWAATFVAAKAARVPHGRKAACIHGRPACAFVRQSRPKAPLREPFLPLLAPLHAALAAGGASVASMERGARARSGFACRAWLRATNGRRSAGGRRSIRR